MMTRTFNRRLRHAVGLGAVAMLALPLAAQAADYRAQLSEQISTGAVKASPGLTLHAKIDNGNGLAPVPTGWLRFAVDAKHLSPTAWAYLMAASPGTQLGTLTSELNGSVVSPVRVLNHGHDANGAFVRAGVGVTGATASIIGSDTLPIVIRQATTAKPLTFVLDARAAVGKLSAKGVAATLQDVTLALRGSIISAGKSHALTLNPVRDTALTNAVLVRACAQTACTTLQPAAAASVATSTVHLPKTVTLAAPVTATYGYRYSIGGTGRSGDLVILQALTTGGLVPATGTAVVRPDGTFILRSTLRSTFSDDGDLMLPARGRYAAASVEGTATVYGNATQDTHVDLARPKFVLQRKAGNKLHFSIRVPGADRHVHVTIKLGSQTLAVGYATQSGTFSKTIVKPKTGGNLRVVASVAGADTAISAATVFTR